MLEIQKFDKIIAANWKLQGSFDFVKRYLDELNSNILEKQGVCSIVCPPSIYLHKLVNNLKSIFLGAQDCSNYNSGAYTGEVSANMLKELSCNFCIVGHSERRKIFKQSNKDICLKAKNLLDQSIHPIICIGETLEEKNKNLTKEVLFNQISKSIPNNGSKNSVILAYEPIWAIGTSLTPSLEEINDIHYFIKNEIQNFKNYKVIYGGSVKSNNATNIMELNNVDGVLVGGASLDPLEFRKIMNS